MKKLVFILFVFFDSVVNGQSVVFNNTYDNNDSLWDGTNFITEFNSKYFVSNTVSDYVNDDYFVRIYYLDEEGVVQENNSYSINPYTDFCSGAIMNNNFIYAIGATSDPNENGKFDSYLIKLDENLDSVYSKIIDIGYHDGGNNIKKINDNKFIFLAFYYSDSTILENSQVVLVTIDTLGNVLDQWEYGGPSYDFAYDYKQTADGGFIIGGKTRTNINADADLFLRKVDSVGTTEWYHEYGTSNEENVRTWNYVETTTDGGYLILGEELLSMTPTRKKAILTKFDSFGSQVFQIDITPNVEYSNSANVRVWKDQNIIISGGVTYYDSIVPFFNSPRGYLQKYTSDGQTLIWERFFSHFWDQDDYVHDMILTADGGILVSGYILGVPYTRNDAWLTKFDSCGYTVGDTPAPFFVVDSIVNTKESGTVFITEQSQDYCTAEIDWGDGSENTFYYAYENNLPLAEKQLQHTYTENGTFTIKTTTLAGEEFRSYEVDVVINGISVGVESVIPAQAGISFFPNPADDYVIVQNQHTPNPSLEGNVREQFSAHIYDLNGKQVKTFGLNPKLYQQKIDISSLVNGVYFVNFLQNGEIGDCKIVVK